MRLKVISVYERTAGVLLVNKQGLWLMTWGTVMFGRWLLANFNLKEHQHLSFPLFINSASTSRGQGLIPDQWGFLVITARCNQFWLVLLLWNIHLEGGSYLFSCVITFIFWVISLILENEASGCCSSCWRSWTGLDTMQRFMNRPSPCCYSLNLLA